MGFQPQVEVQKSLRKVQRQFRERLDQQSKRVDAANRALAEKIGAVVASFGQLNRTTRHWDTLRGDPKRSLPPSEGEGGDGGDGIYGLICEPIFCGLI